MSGEAILSDLNAIKWEAAQWVERRMSGDALDEAAFEVWFEADQQHRSAYNTMWQRVMGAPMDKALHSFQRRGTAHRTWVAGGAVALIGAYAAMPQVALYLAEPRHIAAAAGTIHNVTLPDGTQLTLAGGARVRIRYTRHHRVVALEQGTIFANVAHDVRRPFRVDAGDALIENIGTSYEVSRRPGSVRVIVTAGAVRFGTSGWFGKRIGLTAEQTAILEAGPPHRTADMAPQRVARWRIRWATYRGAPLSEVVDDLQALSPLPIRIVDRSLANKSVSGRILLTDPARQLENLSIIHAFRIQYRPDEIVITTM